MPITINGTTGIAGVDGSAGTPSVQGADTNTGMFFPAADTIAFAEGGVEAMRIDSSGNVGIGTSSPNNTLQVTGTSYTTGKTYIGNNTNFTNVGNLGWSPTFIVEDTNGQGIATVRNTADAYGGTINLVKSRGTLASPSAVTNGDRLGQIYFGGYDSVDYSNTGASIEAIANATWTSNSCPSDLVFSTTVSGSFVATERMRIDSSGNLLLNTTTVRNTAKFTIDYNGASAQGLVLNNTDTSAASQLAMQFYRGATPSVVGQITTTNSATAYVTSSDYRLKENIAPITGALAKVQALKPVTYKWKIDGSSSDGFIAHELAEVCPQAVYGEKDAVNAEGDIVPQGIDTSFLVATLTAAIQEQQALITQLQADVAALKGTP